jgi:4-alpha-glucanotransferase
MFNPEGQKWGLAPISPTEVVARDFAPVRRSYRSILRHAGALRIDHAMSLHRLFWIPAGFPARDGAYALYPMTDLVRALAEASQEHHTIVIGEDLGVVPDGFRTQMERAAMFGYRIFYFERNEHGFVAPEHWTRNALACVGSHDTPTLAGWWAGRDIDERERVGFASPEHASNERGSRNGERAEVLGILRGHGWHDIGETFGKGVAVGVHRLVARTPSRLMAAQLEDLVGMVEQANIPGTVEEHPNWRRRLPVAIENLADHPLLRAILDAIAQERPRSP